MTLEDEEHYIGHEAHEVPKIEPGEKCNGKRTENTQDEDRGTLTLFQGYCKNKAGKGTDHVGKGRCKYHGGQSTGAPQHNQNGTKHGANADPHHVAQSMAQADREFVQDTAAAIEDRIRSKKGDVDFLDRILSRRVAYELHIVAKETDYVENVSGLLQTIQTEHGSHEDEAPLLQDIRKRDKDILGMLKTLGVLDDPESQKADALDEWRQFVSGNARQPNP